MSTQYIQEPFVYKGMTEKQLTDAFHDEIAIPNFNGLIQENRERSQLVKSRLNPIQDVAYGSDEIQKLDIYQPKNSKITPVLISLHGGGWTMGSKNSWAISAEPLMSEGILSLSIDYGLAPQYRMQDIIRHVREAIAWTYQNISQYNGDPNRIYIYGMSAGAHLAATALLPGWQKSFNLSDDIVKGLVAMSGIYDLCTLVHAPNTRSQKALQLSMEDAQVFSPLHRLPQHPVPSIIAYGEKEPLILYRYEAEQYAQALKNSGCHVDLIEVPHANHFDMINAMSNAQSHVFNALKKMIFK